MAGRDQIEEIKNKLDISNVVGRYVPSLKKSGHNHFGLCPFHSEKTPSFSVNSELRLFKCFGCGEGGDVIRFLEKVEGLDFPRALELAAKEAGVELVNEYGKANDAYAQEKKKLLAANALAAEYFAYVLLKHQNGKVALKYAHERRKLQDATLQKFQIGFAPSGFENLKKFLLKKGFTAAELVKWGLLVEKNGRIYDKFRARLMFPIANHVGDIVGFSGRLIDPEAKGPKYLNSPETLVFKKNGLLYGLFQAKEHLRKTKKIIIVEGNVDILSSHQAGIGSIVAPLGTALTSEQLKLAQRYADEVTFAFDSDEAGKKALLRALVLAEEVGLPSRVLDLGERQDVDDLITAGDDWSACVKSSRNVVDYLIDRLARDYDLHDARAKTTYVKQILPYIAAVKADIEKSEYLQRVSYKSGVDHKVILSEFRKVSQGSSASENIAQLEIHEIFAQDKYLLALLVQNKKLLQAVDKEEIIAVLDENLARIVEAIFTGNYDLENEDSTLLDLNMMKVDEYETAKDFAREVQAICRSLHLRKIKAELGKLQLSHGLDAPEGLQQLQKLTKELAALSKA